MTKREQIIEVMARVCQTALESAGYIVRPRVATEGKIRAADTAMTEAWDREQMEERNGE